ncbi:efflux RND transporter periplasmic adaptor subunit [Novosphingobium sp. MBES04]|uniref:efflux RND transporter periplasmic adaptor subunit n=1 Tax=Novosphingobium sp. MBES04 TaxID=1206458 RepID=UPI00057C62DD|nr:efflux RND transporter periplasmic adaptor subunit [Novosphingobium sp. MBES04]GAM03628.1 RND family efflux transporter MFP subunit [Novosphingobium sp. MBES04]
MSNPETPGTQSTDSSLDTFLGAAPRRGRRQLISFVVLVLAIIAIATLFVRFVAGNDDPYYVASITSGDFVPRLSEAGMVHGAEELAIRARLDGRLADLPVKSGDTVKYGQVLARIEAPGGDETLAAHEARLASAQADVEAAEVSVSETSTRLARFERVWRESDHRVPSTNEMESARADARRAREGLAAAQGRRDAAQNDVEAEKERARGRVIRAPFDGVVVVHNLSQGQGVLQDMLLFTLVHPGSKLTLRVPLASEAAMALEPGAEASVRLEAQPDVAHTAVLDRIEDASGQRVAHFRLTGATEGIEPGMAARVEVALAPRSNVLLVPDAALEFRPDSAGEAMDGRDSIYLVGEDGNPRRVFVTAGGSDGGRTEVFSSQLEAGEDVIIGWREAPQAPATTGN